MSNPTDELAELKAAEAKLRKTGDAIYEKLQEKLEHESVLLRVTRLRTEIEMAKRHIETITVLAQSRKAKPEVGDHLRRLKELEGELEELKAKHGLQSEDTPHKRWWQFWK